MNINVPESITVEQATQFANSVVNLLNDRGWDIASERFVSVDIEPNRAEVSVVCDRSDPVWTAPSPVSTFHIDEATYGDFTAEQISWCESVGLEAKQTINVSLRPNYMQVTGFVCREDGTRTLRQDGSGFLKYTVDIPIENGDSK